MRLSILISISLQLFSHTAISQISNSGIIYSESDIFPEDETSCHQACTALLEAHPDSTYYSSTPLYSFQQSFYTAQQQSVIPACIVTPPTALVVSSILRIISDHSCHFTVKSGGHATFTGASNSDGGISIDLRLLNEIEDLEDRDAVRVGTGNRWMDVYAKLEALEKMVVGGRNGDVGVGGFLLGGGISYFSRRYRWACDTILAFTLILPNGTITTVTPTSSPELFTALKGGGSNFGIVTSFDLRTFPQKQIFAGSNIYVLPPSAITKALSAMSATEASSMPPNKVNVGIRDKMQVLATKAALHAVCLFKLCTGPLTLSRAFVGSLEATKGDPNAQICFALSWAYNTHIASVTLSHTLPPLRWDLTKPPPPPPDTILRSEIDPIELEDVEKAMALEQAQKEKLSPWSWDQKNHFLPHCFRNFTDLPRVWTTNKVQNMTERLREVGRSDPVKGLRHFWATLTFHLPSPFTSQSKFLAQIIDIWIQETAHLHGIPGVEPSMLFQPLYPEFFEHAKKNGGNAMKVDPRPEKGPLILLSLHFTHLDPADDSTLSSAGTAILTRIRELADTTLASDDDDEGLMHEFVYMNYADAEQDVFAGYGGSEHLRMVQRDVDPQGMWRRLKRGGFVV